jgi:cell division protein FtsQ
MKLGSSEQSSSNRAEDVRRRRAQRSQQRVNVVSTRITSPVNNRPVTTRGNGFGTPIHRQAGTRARRQFYLTVDQAAGTEMRLPAIRLGNPGWRLVSGILAIAMMVGIFSMWSSPYFQVQGVEVTGLQRLNSEELNNELKFDQMSVLQVNTDEIRNSLITAFPELMDVQVDVKLPNIVTVTAAERTPVMALRKGELIKWIDAEGVIFPARGDVGPLVTVDADTNLPTLPVINPAADAAATAAAADTTAASDSKNQDKIPVTSTPGKVDPAFIAAAKGLAQKLPPETQLVYSAADGLGWTDSQGWKVYIGKELGNFEEKYALYQKIAEYLNSQGLKAQLVSVERLDAPFYRLEQ